MRRWVYRRPPPTGPRRWVITAPAAPGVERFLTRAGTIELDDGDFFTGKVYVRQVDVFGGVDGVTGISTGDTFALKTRNSTPRTIYANTSDRTNWSDVRYFNRWFFGLTATVTGGGRIMVHSLQAKSFKTVNTS